MPSPGSPAADDRERRLVAATPADVALRMLELRFGRPASSHAPDRRLTRFQQDAVVRLRAIIVRHGGALLSDSVGLGKTHIACGLIREVSAAGRPVLVSAPAQLAAHWRKHLRGVPRWSWLSHAALSRGRTWPGRGGGGRPFVVVDEAHAFRNPGTARYRALAASCAGADVLLVTATPVNNGVEDFCHLVRLFAGDDGFAAIGVPDLAGAMHAAARAGDVAAIRRVAEAVVVRRTRRLVQEYYAHEADDGAAPALRFPREKPVRIVTYATGAGSLFEEVVRPALLDLRFPAHRAGQEPAAPELMRLSLLKRLESSAAAFHASLRRHAALLHQFVRAAEAGYVVTAREYRALFRDRDGALQLPLDGVALRRWPPDLDRQAFIADALRDISRISTLLARVPGPAGDPKLGVLRQLLEEDEIRAEPVLVFTEFRDTAFALWRALVAGGGVGLVTGTDARMGEGRSTRRAVIERFAPRANHARRPPQHQRIRILVATDVLAEGLNLQDARTLVSYDLPWNPVRLAQRIGRIDRLGSPHEEIAACVFRPAGELERLIGIIRRLRHKLRAIRIVGGDAPRFGDGRPRPRTVRTTRFLAQDDRGSELGEALRLEYARRALAAAGADGTGRACSSGPSGGGRRPVPVASIPLPHTAPGAVCCVRTATSVLTATAATGEEVRFGDVRADEALLQALADPQGLPPDLAAAARAADRVIRAARQRLRPAPGGAGSPEGLQAGRLVHQWLASRPGGATTTESEQAEALLEALSRCTSPAARLRLRHALRRLRDRNGPAPDLLQMLRNPVAGDAGRTPPEPAGVPRIEAILMLLPTQPGGDAAG